MLTISEPRQPGYVYEPLISTASELLDMDDFLTPSQLAALPRPGWLLDGILPRGGLVCMFGPSGAGKSFLALDWALTVASGKGSWFGQNTQSGTVFYIAGEGANGITQRINAWLSARGIPESAGENLLVRVKSCNLLESDFTEELLKRICTRADNSALIVVDTLARCFGEGDENSTRDMGRFITSLDTVRATTGATVLVVHHTGKETQRGARGSSALHAASDTMLEVKASDNIILLTCAKQKDAAPFDTWRLKLTTAGESAVVNPAAGRETKGPLVATEQRLLEELAEPVYSNGAKKRELSMVTDLEERTVLRAVNSLMKRGYIKSNGESPNSPKYAYVITLLGHKALRGDVDCNTTESAG